MLGLKAKIFAKKRHAEKATMKKTIAMHNERENKHKAVDETRGSAVPAYLLERDQVGWGSAPMRLRVLNLTLERRGPSAHAYVLARDQGGGGSAPKKL